MNVGKDDYKIIAAAGVGILGGLLISSFLRSIHDKTTPLSQHLATLSKLVEQVENIDSQDAENLKNSLHNILSQIESKHDNTEE